MTHPNLKEEKLLWSRGLQRVAGLDEAGVGPLAGPVSAAAVILNQKQLAHKSSRLKKILREVNDSKKLSAKKREELFGLITGSDELKWGVGIVSEKIIDKINIKNAAELAMVKAIADLKAKNEEMKVDCLIIGGKVIKNKKLISYNPKVMIDADMKVFSVAAASILAKVTRDRLLVKISQKYPEYRFNVHKGYSTKLHRQLLQKLGPCKVHRRSFAPVKLAMNHRTQK